MASVATHVALAETAAMKIGGFTSQPIGHFDFCKRYPTECAVRSQGGQPERMSEQFRERLSALTLAVNEAVKPVNDTELFGREEFWTYPGRAGDCEDYVLEKRRILMQEGVSPSNLLITVVRKPDGEGHAVLTVRTDVGDLVLDNLSDVVKPWYETKYTYLKRQASTDTGRWVTIREDHAPLVGSVK
ncbi:transglutaminase-like cysteine peptidase [Chelativorans intermedius]|nr:transglutaminase-like cysteine peptidase [Chelativorans intermedius]